MRRSRRIGFLRASGLAVVTLLLVEATAVSARAAEPDPRRYNTDYIYALTRSVPDLSAPPAALVPLVPLTLVADTVCLPFALVLGFFG